MSTDWRALCEELLGALENEGHAHWPGGPDGDPLIEQARAVLARWGRPAPAPAREVAELVALLRHEAADDEINDHLLWMTPADARRAADLLERQAVTEESSATAPASAGEVGELVTWLREGGEDAAANGWDHQAQQFARAAELLEQCQAALLRGGRQTLQQRLTNAMHHVTANRLDQRQVAQAPLPVSERPWERDGWCHPQERWAWFYNRRVGWRDAIPPESLKPPTLFPYTHSLPFNALPLPAAQAVP